MPCFCFWRKQKQKGKVDGMVVSFCPYKQTPLWSFKFLMVKVTLNHLKTEVPIKGWETSRVKWWRFGGHHCVVQLFVYFLHTLPKFPRNHISHAPYSLSLPDIWTTPHCNRVIHSPMIEEEEANAYTHVQSVSWQRPWAQCTLYDGGRNHK